MWSDFFSSTANVLSETTDYSDEIDILKFYASGKSKKLTSGLSGDKISRMPKLH